MGVQGTAAKTVPGWSDDGVERGVIAKPVKSVTRWVDLGPAASASFCELWTGTRAPSDACAASPAAFAFIGSEVKGKV